MLPPVDDAAHAWARGRSAGPVARMPTPAASLPGEYRERDGLGQRSQAQRHILLDVAIHDADRPCRRLEPGNARLEPVFPGREPNELEAAGRVAPDLASRLGARIDQRYRRARHAEALRVVDDSGQADERLCRRAVAGNEQRARQQRKGDDASGTASGRTAFENQRSTSLQLSFQGRSVAPWTMRLRPGERGARGRSGRGRAGGRRTRAAMRPCRGRGRRRPARFRSAAGGPRATPAGRASQLPATTRRASGRSSLLAARGRAHDRGRC